MMKTDLRAFWLLALLLALIGCGDPIELNRGLSENDANEVIAALGRYQITAEKRVDKTGVTLIIDAQNMERAVNILNAAGLPRQSRTTLGEVFQKSGVISTPLEERARYIYALSQEVEATLTQIDGVLVARVHVVLPERIAPGEPVQPASAAVFIKYRPELDPDSVETRIRRMVASSIPGLSGKSDKDLSIVFVPAEPYRDVIPVVTLGPFTLTPQAVSRWQWSAALLGLLVTSLLAWRLGGPHVRQWRQKRAQGSHQPH